MSHNPIMLSIPWRRVYPWPPFPALSLRPIRTIKGSAVLERSSVTAKIALEGKAVKGLSRHKRSLPLPCNPIYSMIPLTAYPSHARWCLTEDRPEPLMISRTVHKRSSDLVTMERASAVGRFCADLSIVMRLDGSTAPGLKKNPCPPGQAGTVPDG